MVDGRDYAADQYSICDRWLKIAIDVSVFTRLGDFITSSVANQKQEIMAGDSRNDLLEQFLYAI